MKSWIILLSACLLAATLFGAAYGAGDDSVSKPLNVELLYQPPEFEIRISFMDPDGNRMLDAGQLTRLEIVVKNKGEGKARSVRITPSLVEKNPHVAVSPTQSIPLLKPGESKTLYFDLTSRPELTDGVVKIAVEVKDAAGHQARPIELSLSTLSIQDPQLMLTDYGIDDSGLGRTYGDGDGRAEPGETIEVTFIVQNRGRGRARNARAELQVPEQVFFVGSRTENLGDLGMGDFRKIKFLFAVYSDYSASRNLRFPVKITEETGRYGCEGDIQIALGEVSKTANQMAEPQKLEIRGNAPMAGTVPVQTVRIDVDEPLPPSTVKNNDAFAVVIGISHYRHQDIPDVEFALRDAQVMREYLINAMGFPEGNILYITDEEAGKAKFEYFFGTKDNYKGRLYNLIKPGISDVFIFYSGHGAPDPNSNEAFFVPADGDVEAISLTGYSLTTFYQNLDKLPAKNVVVALDCCFSGGTHPGNTLMQKASPIMVKPLRPTSERAVVFTSGAEGQISSWYPDMHHGLFTYFFLKGLRGKADRDGDGKISVGEMKIYLTDQTQGVPYIARKLFNRDQLPTVSGNDDLILLTK